MIRYTIITALLLASIVGYAEPLTLEQCYQAARTQYPLIKQKELIDKSKNYSLENASKGYLPQVFLSGQATYQSAVTQVPITIPGVDIEAPSKDQYRVVAEVSQSITDPFVIKPQKQLLQDNAAIEQQKLEVELYRIKERINQLYFGTLLIDEQLKQTELLKADIQTGITRMKAAIDNGVALKSSLTELNVEVLKINQRVIELKAARKAYTDMLALFINRTIDESTVLEKPKEITIIANINRPELMLYEHQRKSIDIQDKIITAKNLPRASVYVQGGVGKPGLNMLKNSFDPYYIAGLRFSWALSGFYTFKKEKKIQDVNRSIIDVQKETFLFNTQLSLWQQNGEIVKLQELIRTDNEIIDLRNQIKTVANAQLANGVITANDYLLKVNAEDQARQNLLLHGAQLLMAQYAYQTTSGN